LEHAERLMSPYDFLIAMQAVQGRMLLGEMTFAASTLQYAYHPYISKLLGFAAAGP